MNQANHKLKDYCLIKTIEQACKGRTMKQWHGYTIETISLMARQWSKDKNKQNKKTMIQKSKKTIHHANQRLTNAIV